MLLIQCWHTAKVMANVKGNLLISISQAYNFYLQKHINRWIV